MFKLTHFLWFFIPLYGFAQASQPLFAPRHYVCYRTPTVLTIDGHLNETAWQHGIFAGNLAALKADTIEYNEQVYLPYLEVTASMFEAYCTNPTTDVIWHINQEGKVWR